MAIRMKPIPIAQSAHSGDFLIPVISLEETKYRMDSRQFTLHLQCTIFSRIIWQRNCIGRCWISCNLPTRSFRMIVKIGATIITFVKLSTNQIYHVPTAFAWIYRVNCLKVPNSRFEVCRFKQMNELKPSKNEFKNNVQLIPDAPLLGLEVNGPRSCQSYKCQPALATAATPITVAHIQKFLSYPFPLLYHNH